MKLLESTAKILAGELFKDILDDCKKPYIQHIEQVVSILEQITDDEHILAAAWLHDVVEDTDYTAEEIKATFGQRVHDLVMEVTHDGQADNRGYYFPRLQSKDAILIKFADRLSNLSRMESWTEERKDHYLRKSKFWKSE